MAVIGIRCKYPGFCCDKGKNGECVSAEDFQCKDKVIISDDEAYQKAKKEGRVTYAK
ncbi:hypothetical protein LCGC14_0732940 [marine sediment metagenome]|uniref:Uncharacterized protein n=1 Tax=marine sediment metagenome TaxID=412755 RepID=A0A0F9Q943_9ZZZZ